MRDHARAIWQAGVDAVRGDVLVRRALADADLGIRAELAGAKRVLVLGGGKAGAAMAAGVETALADFPGKIEGVVNVPAEAVRALKHVELHAARPAGTNQPTAAGVAGVRKILELAQAAGPEDVGLCLISGGGSALLPAPAQDVTLEDKQHVTQLLHSCGATINDMNAVRKHLSAIKGGRLAQAFAGRALFSLIISDVIGDPLDVIASGPTAADPTTFADALAIFKRYGIMDEVPPAVREHLEFGVMHRVPETLKALPGHVHNFVIGNNAKALAAAHARAVQLGYPVLNLGSYIEGETRHVGATFAGIVRSLQRDRQPMSPPLVLLSGGETTVTLTANHGTGGRNQEFVLAVLGKLGAENMAGVVILSGGTDGEDGPTNAAGAVADAGTLQRAAAAGLDPQTYLDRHDAYSFFQAADDLLLTGLTQTNVMDVRVILVSRT
jgi:hydroxypyruvate reductase/glycerate 2-kinase